MLQSVQDILGYGCGISKGMSSIEKGGTILSKVFKPQVLIILAGLIFGILAAFMTEWGNPANMGICAACFLRDMAGGLGLHQANTALQYIRPEIMGFVLGAFVAAFAFREFRARGGSSPIIRFFLGAFVS